MTTRIPFADGFKSDEFRGMAKAAFIARLLNAGIDWHGSLSYRERAMWNDVFFTIRIWHDNGDLVTVVLKEPTPLGGEPIKMVDFDRFNLFLEFAPYEGYQRVARAFAYLIFRHFREWAKGGGR